MPVLSRSLFLFLTLFPTVSHAVTCQDARDAFGSQCCDKEDLSAAQFHLWQPFAKSGVSALKMTDPEGLLNTGDPPQAAKYGDRYYVKHMGSSYINATTQKPHSFDRHFLVMDVVSGTVKRVDYVPPTNANGNTFVFTWQYAVGGDHLYIGGAFADNPQIPGGLDYPREEPAIYKMSMATLLTTTEEFPASGFVRLPDPQNLLVYYPPPFPGTSGGYATGYSAFTVGKYVHFKGFNFLTGNPGLPPERHVRVDVEEDTLEALDSFETGLVTKPFAFRGGFAAFTFPLDMTFAPKQPAFLRLYPNPEDMSSFTDVQFPDTQSFLVNPIPGGFGYTGYEIDENHVLALSGAGNLDWSVIFRIDGAVGSVVADHDAFKTLDAFQTLYYQTPSPPKEGFSMTTDTFRNLFTSVSDGKLSRMFNDGHYVTGPLA